MKSIQEILAYKDASNIFSSLTTRKKGWNTTVEEVDKQYEPKTHKIFDTQYRKKKKVKVPTGKNDPVTGNPIYKDKLVERVRIAVPVQKVLVERNVGVLFGIPVEYRIENPDEANSKQHEELFKTVKKIFHQNKMKYFDKRLARLLFRQRECAELWYMTTDTKGKPTGMKVKLLGHAFGDKLYPHFNDYDDMDGFARVYKVYNEDNTYTEKFDVYTDRLVYSYINVGGKGWVLQGTPKQHGFNRIPIVYYRIDQTVWEDVQSEIERVEDLISNWGDTNDYFGTPKYFVRGKLNGFAEKGEQGSVFQGDKDTAMDVLSWNNSPESVRNELSTLFNIIFSYTQSCDFSFENMKQLGSNTSGAAIRLMFTDPHMKAGVQTELFGEMATRRCNIVKSGVSTSGVYVQGISDRVADELDIVPVYTPYAPKNDVEMLELINKSNGGAKSTSQRRAIELNPINDNPTVIEEELKKEQEEAMAIRQQLLGAGDTVNE